MRLGNAFRSAPLSSSPGRSSARCRNPRNPRGRRIAHSGRGRNRTGDTRIVSAKARVKHDSDVWRMLVFSRCSIARLILEFAKNGPAPSAASGASKPPRRWCRSLRLYISLFLQRQHICAKPLRVSLLLPPRNCRLHLCYPRPPHWHALWPEELPVDLQHAAYGLRGLSE